MGTGDIAIPSFRALANNEARDLELVGLITQPDKPVGRKQVMTPPQIKNVALEFGVPVIQPEKVRTPDALEQIAELAPDLIVVMAYGQILPKSLLDLPSLACINLHASLLPKHRGASCIQAAIALGDEVTGITAMHMTEALDEGDIICADEISIGSDETGGQLHDRLADLAPKTMMSAVLGLRDGAASREPQDHELANYAPKLLRQHGEIDWSKSATDLSRLIRAYEPWPGTYTTYNDAKGRSRRLKIFSGARALEQTYAQPGQILECSDSLVVACGSGSIEVTELQPEGGKRMRAEEFMRSGVLKAGLTFGKDKE